MLFSLVLGGAASAAPPPEVQVESGRLHGVQATDLSIFRGIPYAAPPVGDLRWKAPVRPLPWTGVRPADQFGRDCMQHRSAALGPANTARPAPSEDCLTLNVWTPSLAHGAKRPVMVWIYGGGYVLGAGSQPQYDGAQLARQGVVLVTINYRLGRFGFFAHPALTAEANGAAVGNYGIMDQLAALAWVKRNIAAFGGDPGNVTIFGESAGASFVSSLLVSPRSARLFQKAIVQSKRSHWNFPRLSRTGPDGKPSAEAGGVAFATSAGLLNPRPAQLRALSPEVVLGSDDLDASRRAAILRSAGQTGGAADLQAIAPIIDGQILRDDVEAEFAAGHLARVPIMLGTNTDESNVFPGLRENPALALARFGPALDGLLKLYDPTGARDRGDVAAHIMTAAFFQEPYRELAKSSAAAGTPTYLYRFGYLAEQLRPALGVRHGGEIMYVFGVASGSAELAPQDIAVGEMVRRYWTSFAKTGDPNAPGLPRWPRFMSQSQFTLDFTNEGAAAREDLDREKLDYLEDQYRKIGWSSLR
jgi:para-nitrobenzyl esterase